MNPERVNRIGGILIACGAAVGVVIGLYGVVEPSALIEFARPIPGIFPSARWYFVFVAGFYGLWVLIPVVGTYREWRSASDHLEQLEEVP